MCKHLGISALTMACWFVTAFAVVGCTTRKDESWSADPDRKAQKRKNNTLTILTPPANYFSRIAEQLFDNCELIEVNAVPPMYYIRNSGECPVQINCVSVSEDVSPLSNTSSIVMTWTVAWTAHKPRLTEPRDGADYVNGYYYATRLPIQPANALSLATWRTNSLD